MTLPYNMPQLLKALIDQGASDLHICADSAPRLRISGRLYPLDLPPLSGVDTKQLCYGILTDVQKRDFEAGKELDMAFSIKGLARFRCNIYTERGCVAAAFRVIPLKIFSIKDLNLPPVIEYLSMLPRGLVLITGPTGSGKSTTLAAMIDFINETRNDHIVTIEDPIEFIHSHKNSMISQRELGGDTDSFARALKSVLRQDPNVVMVGELRDLETVQLALTTAETGHLVLATLHTNSAVSTLNRMIDVFPSHQQMQVRTQLAFNLMGVVSQILLPSTAGGRVLAMEVMIPNVAIRNLMREDKLHQIYSAMQSGQESSGMQTLNQSLANLFERRLVSRETAVSKSPDLEELENLLEKRNRGTKTVSQNSGKKGA